MRALSDEGRLFQRLMVGQSRPWGAGESHFLREMEIKEIRGKSTPQANASRA
jgi:hypothetical protein